MRGRTIKKFIAGLLSVGMIINCNVVPTLANEIIVNYYVDENYEGTYNYNEDDVVMEEPVESVTEESVEEVVNETESVASIENAVITFTITDQWNNGYNAKVVVENISDAAIEDWMLEFTYDGEISNIWNATVLSHDENKYVIKNATWNQDIPAGKTIEFGISGTENFPGFPSDYKILGSLDDVDEESYSVEYKLVSDYNSGYSASISIANNTDKAIEDWELEFDFARNISCIWNAEILKHEGSHYVIKNAGHNANIAANSTISFGFNGNCGSPEDVPSNYRLCDYELYSGDSEELDTDGDGIVDAIETAFGLSYKKEDTDGDGLSDYVEIFVLRTDPLKADSDDNGILDPDEDIDNDGLSNIEELNGNTDPSLYDTDGDGLSDYEEIYDHNSDPLATDTDGDGLSDYEDVKLGFSPLLQDTDGNGILDPDEKVEQTYEKVFDEETGRGITKVSVSMNVNGFIDNSASIVNTYDFDSLSRGVVGLVGVPVNIKSSADFDKATITFTYDEAALGDVNEEDLAVLWYDEANNWYQILDKESVVDTVNNTVSYTTTHFSTYMLVNREGWYEAWRENIDYRISSDGDTQIHYFDIAFVVDVSGSMGGSNITNAKTALNNFLNVMQDGDEAALVRFNSYAYTVRDFTGDTADLRSGVNSLSASGGTNVNNGLTKALELFNARTTDRERIVVLICDGDVNYYQSTIDQFIDGNIKIYAINVQSSSAHVNLQKMADQTGGQYYYSSTASDLAHTLGMVQNVTVDKIDPTDNDGDGLYDIYETAGIKLPNGQVIYTDPTMKDTDGDGLSDFEETGLVCNVDDRYVGNYMTKDVKYFVMRSNPADPDSDGDGITDDVDTTPWMADKVVINLGTNHGNEYLNIVDSNGIYAGEGDQNWWQNRTSNPDNTFLNYTFDKANRIWHFGCGLVAMSDMELYLSQKKGYSTIYNSPAYDPATAKIDRDEYMDYVELNGTFRYRLGGIVQYFTGVLPADMECGASDLMYYNNDPNVFASWAPYTIYPNWEEKYLVSQKMEEMLNKDIPIPFAYYTSDSAKGVHLYTSANNAFNETNAYGTVSSHYMTVIGLEKTINTEGTDYDYVMKVTSWGTVYYINYNEYSKNLSYFTNILSVGRLF